MMLTEQIREIFRQYDELLDLELEIIADVKSSLSKYAENKNENL